MFVSFHRERKMAHFRMIVLIYNMLLQCYILLKITEGMQTMCVTPNISITYNQCPGSPCLELNTYIHNASSYFLSDTLFKFLPGNHYLESHVTVVNKVNLQMIGSPNLTQYPISVKVREYGFDLYDEDNNVTYLESSTHITCTSYNETGFIFVNITSLTIINITFVNCGVYINYTAQSADIHLINIYDLLMEGVSVQNSTGYGLLGVNLLGHSQIVRSSFIGNNQHIKNDLQNNTANSFKCNGKAYPSNTLYYNGTGNPNGAGGNMFIEYTDIGDYNGSSQMDISSLVFSLGVASLPNPITFCSPGTGLVLNITQEKYYINITIQNSIFYRNQAVCGGNIYVSFTSVNFDISLYNSLIIRAVSALGGLYIDYKAPHSLEPIHSSLSMHNVTYECNYALSGGSSIEMDIDGVLSPTSQNMFQVLLINCTFRSDYSDEGSAMIFELNKAATLILQQCCITDTLQTKSALIIQTVNKGSAILYDCFFRDSPTILLSTEVLITTSTFYNSRISASQGTTITLHGHITFNSSTNGPNGGAISLSSSTIIFSPHSNVIFFNNSAVYGGAIYMIGSYLNYSSPSNVSFINNTALLAGGAIYVVSPLPQQYYSMPCFYQFYKVSIAHIDVYFEGNIAIEAGSAIYGGDIDHCRLDYCENCKSNAHLFNKTHHFGYHDNSTSLISSDPQKICTCNATGCNHASVIKTVYPGEHITVEFLTLGQNEGISPGVVFVYSESPILSFTSVLRSSNYCKAYEMPHVTREGKLYLATELTWTSGKANIYNLTITIMMLPCPVGFVMDSVTSSCICDPLLGEAIDHCYVANQTLLKSGEAWIGYNSEGNLSVIDPCPSDYCTNQRNVDVYNFNSQCTYNRVGVACGQCAGNLSMTFGTSQCKPCTNVHLLLIIVFAIMGMGLIVILMLSNLTVSSGTINGIILYAFIIRLYDNIFFPTSFGAVAKVLDFLSVFIAWFNLDLGIETCFYEGMDAYSKVWLQFCFPLYVAVLVVAIIVVSRWSSVISRINMVPVISTLMIFFYAKLLRVVIAIFSYTAIESINCNNSNYVWYYDSAVPYFGPKHAPLFTAGLVVIIFFILPYTAVMLLTPCLVTKSHWKVMCWMNKLKPFIDCYEAPFKDRYRFWTGVTLFHRIVFCLVFGLVPTKQPTIVLLIIIVTHTSMIVMIGLALYKHWLVSLQEGFFHINIVLHSAVLFFLYNGNGHIISAVPTVIFVGSAFICFLCILLFRILNCVMKSNYFNVHCLHYSRVINEDNTGVNIAPSATQQTNVSTLEYVYREPLMSDNS